MSSYDKRVVRENHCRSKENKIDPDDGNSWRCGACNLPIFSTPFVDIGGVRMHDCCANLPKELKDSVVHPNETLLLTPASVYPQNDCVVCGAWLNPSIMTYRCTNVYCKFQIHMTCALPMWIRILHRSHVHRLMAIRSRTMVANSIICSVCGIRHDKYDKYQPSSSASDDDDQFIYVCIPCNVWIHPRCASLPNAIHLYHRDPQLNHKHPLLLHYYAPTSTTCSICRRLIMMLGMYSCRACRYNVHIMCANSHPHSIEQVLIREARLPDFVHLPIANEHASLVRHLTSITTSTGDYDVLEKEKYVHPHSLVLHHDGHDNDDDDPHLDRVCRACFQFIFPPFYSCSKCPKFFLHDFCAHLPHKLTRHITHDENHPILLSQEAVSWTKSCKSCKNKCINGLSYSCKICNIDLHVLCALMPTSITHAAHVNTHILYAKYFFDVWVWVFQWKKCDCCGKSMNKSGGYACGTCNGFIIHAVCAQLPRTVGHKYDEHPLNLVTTKRTPQSSHELVFCEICEEVIEDDKVWYYSCKECDQSFHVNCIPCLERVKIGEEEIGNSNVTQFIHFDYTV